jgi:porin
MKISCSLKVLVTFIFISLILPVSAMAYEINEKLSIGGILAGAYQYQAVDNDEDKGRGAVPFQPEISFTPDEKNEFFAAFGFAAGNGLNDQTPFNLAPWAADLEDDVKDINGRNRDYLLQVWYKHTFQFSEEHTLGLTGGIIDATGYLDENAYSNDEYTQFMNEALVNGPNAFLPSYDIGGALEWEISNFSVKGVVMNVGENDEGNSYHFYAAQFGYALDSGLGEGNYRIIVGTTSEQFLDDKGEDKERLTGVTLSFDQQLGDTVGAWIRFGLQDDAAVIDYDALYSGGIDISGKLWGREDDNIGIGYAYLNGGNGDIDSSQVAEVYGRFVLNDYFALTLDVQYVKDELDEGDDPEGFIGGLRMTAEF